jgi:hypothetical protein
MFGQRQSSTYSYQVCNLSEALAHPRARGTRGISVSEKVIPVHPAIIDSTTVPNPPTHSPFDGSVQAPSTTSIQRLGETEEYHDHGYANVTAWDELNGSQAQAEGSSNRDVIATGDDVWKHPLYDVDVSLISWCLDQGKSQHPSQLTSGIPYTSLNYQDECRLTNTQATPLPPSPQNIILEDALMQHLLISTDFSSLQLGYFDRNRVSSLYNRYRALPKTLSDDQLALVYSALCLARYTQLKNTNDLATELQEGGGEGQDVQQQSREDLTYFRMAMDALERWDRPSTYAVWAYFCMLPYTFALGGMTESRKVLSAMGWQIQELGFHKISTAALYPGSEMADTLLCTYHYADM